MDDSDFSRSIHETGNGLHRAGILTDAELRACSVLLRVRARPQDGRGLPVPSPWGGVGVGVGWGPPRTGPTRSSGPKCGTRSREIETACLLPTVLPEEIRALREREALSRADLAYDFHVSPDLVGRWERGKSTPSPVALKLLDLVRRKGIDAIR